MLDCHDHQLLKKIESLLGFLSFGRTYIPDYAQSIKPLYASILPSFSSSSWLPEHTTILRSLQTELLATQFLTRHNTINLVKRILPGVLGFTYFTFNAVDTVHIA